MLLYIEERTVTRLLFAAIDRQTALRGVTSKLGIADRRCPFYHTDVFVICWYRPCHHEKRLSYFPVLLIYLWYPFSSSGIKQHLVPGPCLLFYSSIYVIMRQLPSKAGEKR